MFCNQCGRYYSGNSCGCSSSSSFNRGCSSCDQNNGPCPIQLDASCVVYGKDNNVVSGLTNLALPNGSTLKLILDSVDVRLGSLNVPNWTLPCLRNTYSYTINSMQQFAQAVDTRLCALASDISSLAALAAVPITPTTTTSIALSTTGVNNHTLSAVLRISATSGNLASVISDGLFVTPQVLSADYENKKISISGGNTLDMLNFCGCEDCNGFLGEVSTDPTSPSAGQYWFNTTTNELRIFVHSSKFKFTLTAV